jgi:hypothetical protein
MMILKNGGRTPYHGIIYSLFSQSQIDDAIKQKAEEEMQKIGDI